MDGAVERLQAKGGRRLLGIDAERHEAGLIWRRLAWAEPCSLCAGEIVWRRWIACQPDVDFRAPARDEERRVLLCGPCTKRAHGASRIWEEMTGSRRGALFGEGPGSPMVDLDCAPLGSTSGSEAEEERGAPSPGAPAPELED